MVADTRSEASCCTKCPAPGMVTSVKALSTRFQVPLSAHGNSHLRQNRGSERGGILIGLGIVGAVIIEHGLEVRAIECFDVVRLSRIVFDPASQTFGSQVFLGARLLEVEGVLTEIG